MMSPDRADKFIEALALFIRGVILKAEAENRGFQHPTLDEAADKSGKLLKSFLAPD
jgi:hypothetical protein